MREIGILLAIWLLFLLAGLVTDLIFNRRPAVSALVAMIIGFAGLLAWDWKLINSEYGNDFLGLHVGISIFGFIPALAGAGLAKFFRRSKAGRRSSDGACPTKE